MRLAKTLGAAGALITAALVGGTLIGSTLAVEGDATGTDASAYCDTFMDAFASELGTTREGVVAAGQAAANAAIDAALAAGDITEERAATMRERVAEYDGEGCGWFGPGPGRGGHGPGHVRGFLGVNTIDAAADAFGIEPSELLDEVRDAGSLDAVATARGVSYDEVKAAVLAAVQADLDAAVADGNVTQERADSVLERLTTWLDNGGELRAHRDRGGDDAEDEGA